MARPTGARRRAGRAVVAAGAVVVLGGLTAACGSSSPTGAGGTAVTSHTRTTPANPAANLTVEAPPPTPVALSENGSSVMYPLWNLWVPRYHTQYPTVSITTASTDSLTGVTQALQGAIDIGASDTSLSTAQRQQVSGALDIPLVVASALVVYDLPHGGQPVKLDGPVLADMYRGQVTRWNAAPIAALNPGVTLPSTPVVTVHRADASGDTLVVTQYLAGTDNRWHRSVASGTSVNWPTVPGSVAANGAAGAFEACQRTPGCVSYLPASYRSRVRAAGLGVAELANGSGAYVTPSPAAVRAEAAAAAGAARRGDVESLVDLSAAGGYPLASYEFAVVLRNQSDATRAQAIRSVLGWTVDPNAGGSDAFLATLDFEPLPAQVAALAAAQIQRIH